MVFADQQNKSKNIESIYPLSPMQEGMLFHSLYEPESGVYFEQFSFTIHGNLDISAFELAWRQVVERHPALRTFFVWKNRKKLLQVVRKSVNLPWTNLDWRELSPVEQSEQLEVFLQADRNKGFELDKAPLMRCALIQLAEGTYKFVWSFHHILKDGWCTPIIFKEVFAFYEALKTGFDLSLPLTRPYSDYIAWLQQQDKSIAIAYWQDVLQGFNAPTPLVVDRTVEPNSQQKKTYLEHDLRLSATATATLKSLAQKHHLTLFTFVQGAWALLLSRYSGEEDVVFGATVSGRPPTLSGVESMVGLFINTLPVRVQVESETELLPWLMQLQQQQVEREQYSYSSLSEIGRLSDIPGGSSLFESILVFENYPVGDSLLSPPDGLQIDNLQAIERTNYPLTLVVIPERELSIQISYDGSCFNADTIVRMEGHLLTLLEGMVAGESQKLKNLPLLISAESHQLLVEWNNTTKEYPQDKCIHQLFEEQVERNPDAVAVVFEGEQLTYQQLNARANRIAHYLQSLGVGPEVLVGICVERSLEMVVGLLGILEAGGAYVPLDPTYPTEILHYMLEDAGVQVLLTQGRLVKSLPKDNVHVVYLDTDWEKIALHSELNPKSGVTPNNLAYVIYTSGSTGQPKGVMIPHRGIENQLHWRQTTFLLTAEDQVLQSISFSFDPSVWQIFWPLCFGAKLILAKPGGQQDTAYLVKMIAEAQITVIALVPSLLRVLLEEKGIENCQCLKHISCGGEALPVELVERFWTRMNLENVLFNCYGPTEAAIDVTFWQCKPERKLRTVPIGRPIANTQIYILDRHFQPVGVGVAGELYIGGDGLARGYLNRPDLTRDKFISNPFSDEPGSRLYKTGDKARYLSDGNIEFLGRFDNQVKIRGFRIELGEIEAALTSHPAVEETAVIAREDIPGRKYLAAYIVGDGQLTTSSNLRGFLKEKLPDYMIPSTFVMLSALPLTPNGKIDRHALPKPDTAHQELAAAFVPPRDTVEQQLQKIWTEVLQLPTVGVRDNFFELGGHSLLAMRLMAMIEQCFGKNLPLATLFSSSTIEQIACRLRFETDSLPWFPLITIQSSGNKRPFFCVPGVGGNIIYLYELARHLGSDQPFYGLQAFGLDGESQPHTRVEDIATYFIQAIQTVQPEGPYFLGGHSFGGQVAFEMAIQLLQLGHEVALLAIIDAVSPILSKKLIGVDVDDAALMADFASFIEYTSSLNLEVSKETLASFSVEKQLNYLKERLIRVNLLPLDAGITSVQGLVQVYKANNQAYRLYLPQQVQLSRIALFRAQEVDVLEDAALLRTQVLKEPTLGWNEFSANVEVHVVAGNHMTMMQQPHVHVLAAQLLSCLEGVYK